MRSLLPHPSPDERQVPDLRAVPVPPVARMFPKSGAVDALFVMHLEDGALDTVPLKQADWSARLRREFGYVGCMLDEVALNTADGIHRAAWAEHAAWLAVENLAANLAAELAPFANAVKAQVA